MFESVEFESEGATLRGRFYPARRGPVTAPVVVMAHGFSATITMTTDRYAEVFAAAGLAVLLYDHRNFGESGGHPRFEVNPWLQARGYRDAIDFVVTLPGVDDGRVALWGDSFSGAVVLVVAGVDKRVAAVVAQVGSCTIRVDGSTKRAPLRPSSSATPSASATAVGPTAE